MKIYSPILALISLMTSNAVFPQKISDSYATKEAISLYSSLLKTTQHKKYLVGHQDDLAYGVHWKYQKNRSDVKDVVGDYPALYGWELADLELGHPVNIDSVPFDKMRFFIQEGNKRGGAITMSWHINNPLTGKNAWDTTAGAVKEILPGGTKHELFVHYLDRVASFIGSLKDRNGNLIPILFRPFHELTGNWFWWGTQGCTPEELQTAFRFTVDYLRKTKKLHNLIIVYNTGGDFSTEQSYLRGYPGDNYVDLLSFDIYQYGDSTKSQAFANNLNADLELMNKIAAKHHKLIAVGEMGYNQIPDSHWFTKTVAPVLAKYPIAYTLFWRNAGFKPKDNETEYYLPYKGHPAANDFNSFSKMSQTLFEKEFSKLK